MKGISQYDLAVAFNMQRGMSSSYELDQFYPTLEYINKLASILDINFLCNKSYSKFLLKCDNFKYKLIKWREENNSTKRDPAKLIGVSERGYASWEIGSTMSINTYYKIKNKLENYNLI